MAKLSNLQSIIHTSPATVYTNGNLSTTPVQYPDTLATLGFCVRKFYIANKHATNHVAIGLSATSASPTFTAGAPGSVGANEGITVFPATVRELDVASDMSLWVVASAGSTPVAIRAFDLPV